LAGGMLNFLMCFESSLNPSFCRSRMGMQYSYPLRLRRTAFSNWLIGISPLNCSSMVCFWWKPSSLLPSHQNNPSFVSTACVVSLCAANQIYLYLNLGANV
jgi:hypothetical protein